ncbi:MAG: hypothetical protein LQ340_001831 [Diploschistes diacapsis]|nr:MAG: hypothetical protein LQ340_001831 [Diploschistes diacapsis]
MASKPPSISNPKKRTASSAAAATGRGPKFTKLIDARKILAQTSDPAINNMTGELNVASFVKAREFEIRALENSMAASKQSAATRAFQQVPRELRRRTASHNVKRAPRRLRARAAKEVRQISRRAPNGNG